MDLGIHFQPIVTAQILLIQPLQFFGHIHVPVEINVAVGGMIVRSVEIKKCLIRQLRHVFGISARLIAIAGIRKQHLLGVPLQHALRGGKRPFHLVVYHAVIRQLPVLFLQLIVPPFLHKDLRLFINIGIQHRVQIYIHQILKILVIGAGHRIHRLVRIRHGIEERVHGTFHQLHKGVFYRKLL